MYALNRDNAHTFPVHVHPDDYSTQMQLLMLLLVSNASFRHKLVQLVVGIAGDLAVHCFCQAIAVAVICVPGDCRAVTVGHGLLYQSVKRVVLILNGAVGSCSAFLNLYALSGCSGL